MAQRTREVGIRIALGAERRTVLAMILGQAMSLAAVGAVAGVIGALVAARAIRGLLYGVGPDDPATYAVSALVLGVAALAAAVLPALRATRVNPMVALRAE